MISPSVKPPPPMSPCYNAFTLPRLRGRSGAFTLPKRRGRSSAFTLVEMLVVIGIILILLVATLPVVNSLSKSSGRKAAVSNLLGAIEQARAQAIKDGQSSYVVFPTFSSGTAQTTLDRYNYKSYAIFEDDTDNPATPKQLTPWKTLPTGVSMRADSASGQALTNLSDFATLITTPPLFTPDNASTPLFRCIKFNANGEVEAAANVSLALFEGLVSGTSEILTHQPIVTETITIARLTGRAEHS